MKRIAGIIVLVAAVAAAAGGWYAYQGNAGGDAGGARPLLAHVPADTTYYFGYSKAYPAADYAMLWQGMMPANAGEDLPDPAEARKEAGDAGAVLMALYQMQIEATRAGEPLARFGLDASGIGGFYEVRGLPVFRRRVADTEAFWKALDEAESSAGVTAGGSEAGQRRYPFKAGEAGEPPALVIAVRDGYVVATLAVSDMADALPVALGKETPAETLNDTDRLAQLADTHETLPWATGFIEHGALAQAFTGNGDSGLGRLITAVVSAYGEEPPRMDDACRDDVTRLTELWPRSVIGLTELDADTGRAGVRLATPVTDPALAETMMRLRGHIPAPADGGVASFGIGVNVSELLPVARELAGRFTAADFQCAPLKGLQAQVARSDLSSLGMATSMLRDVRGAAATVLTPEMNGQSPKGVVEIATPQPKALWSMASGFLGAGEAPEVGGPPVAIQAPMAGSGPVRVALRKDRFIVLAGEGVEIPAASSGDDEALAPNGLLAVRYNLAQASEFLGTMGSLPGTGGGVTDDEELAELQGTLGQIDVDYGIALDVTADSIRYDMTVAPGETP